MKGKARKLLLIFLEKNKHVCKGRGTGFRFQKEIRRVLVSGALTIQTRQNSPMGARWQGLQALCWWQSLEIGTKMKSSWVQAVPSVRWNSLLSVWCTALVFLLCEMLNQVPVSTCMSIKSWKATQPAITILWCYWLFVLNFNWTRFPWTCFLLLTPETMFCFFQFDWPFPWKHLMNA